MVDFQKSSEHNAVASMAMEAFGSSFWGMGVQILMVLSRVRSASGGRFSPSGLLSSVTAFPYGCKTRMDYFVYTLIESWTRQENIDRLK